MLVFLGAKDEGEIDHLIILGSCTGSGTIKVLTQLDTKHTRQVPVLDHITVALGPTTSLQMFSLEEVHGKVKVVRLPSQHLKLHSLNNFLKIHLHMA